jgi:hypothetical protein
MIQIKAHYGDWKEVTAEQAIDFYKTFCSGSTALSQEEKEKSFNKDHIDGATIKAIYNNGRFEPKLETEEQKNERMFLHYKQRIMSGDRPIKNTTRFNVIEYLCSFPKINPYEMAASILKEGWTINYDDSSICINENEIKRRRVEKLLKLQEV